MKRRSLIIVAVILLLSILACSSMAQATDPVQKQVCGVIRNSGSGWEQIGGAHHSVNISSITNDTQKITVTYSFSADYVNTTAVTVDETMASGGYVVGASVGLTEMRIYIYKNGVLINPNNYVNGSGNIWIFGLFEDNE